MSHRICMTNLSSKGGPMNDPKRLAAGRCLAVLQACVLAAPAIRQQRTTPNNELVVAALAEVVFALADHGETLEADLNTLAAMLGCRLVLVDPKKEAQA